MSKFAKWDIVYVSRFPESIQCKDINCKRHFTLSQYRCECPYCKRKNVVSNILAKVRPVILWIDQNDWYKSMAFSIPLSSSEVLIDNDYNQPIALKEYIFLHHNNKYERPLRAIIHQSTRIDGCTLNSDRLIGRITDEVLQRKLEGKLLNWIFVS